MPSYMVTVFCNQCAVPHSTGIVINQQEEISSMQSVEDIYNGRALPPELILLNGNYFQCPATGKMFQQRDNNQVFLVKQL